MTGPNKKGDLPLGPCPYTDCGSSDAFHYNVDGYGYCFSCKRSYPSKDPTVDWGKDTYPMNESIQKSYNPEIVSTTYKGIRGLDEDVARLYNIQAQLDADGNVVRLAYKYPNNVKYRNELIEPDGKAPKGVSKFWLKEPGRPIEDLHGPDFNSGSSKRIYLTEGEVDSAALYQAVGKT